jgi:hypothetical protein
LEKRHRVLWPDVTGTGDERFGSGMRRACQRIHVDGGGTPRKENPLYTMSLWIARGISKKILPGRRPRKICTRQGKRAAGQRTPRGGQPGCRLSRRVLETASAGVRRHGGCAVRIPGCSGWGMEDREEGIRRHPGHPCMGCGDFRLQGGPSRSLVDGGAAVRGVGRLRDSTACRGRRCPSPSRDAPRRGLRRGCVAPAMGGDRRKSVDGIHVRPARKTASSPMCRSRPSMSRGRPEKIVNTPGPGSPRERNSR